MSYRTSPADLEGMPPGVPHIIGNEAAERFSFYGMKAILAVFMVSYLHLMDGRGSGGMNEAEATAKVHLFNGAVYLTPLFGALLADIFLGKYRTIIALSIVYCAGHAALACMGLFGNSTLWLTSGLMLIALGSGGIKPCVSAHVGDQFGMRNAHLLPRIFNWFYFSINLGAFLSMVLTPWLLEWYGPHWAFGVPGVLMALATLLFWMGRHRFIHVPPGGQKFFDELSATGIRAILKLLPLYVFVAMFWALFDQTGSTWIFQAQDMDRSFLGFEWLPSQIQSLNSVFVLTFIPLFSYLLYPAISRIWTLTPLRKIGLGLFVMVTSFALVAVIQQWIDAGQRPNVIWQIAAYALLTAAEVMVSIVALEYAYTQAPRTMKSLLMCLYLGAVAMGNFLVAGVNYFIQIPNTAAIQLEQAITRLPPDWQSSPHNIVLEGYDGVTGTEDDLIQRVVDGIPTDLELPRSESFEKILRFFQEATRTNDALPKPEQLTAALGGSLGSDPWGNPIRYERLNYRTARLIADGPDKKSNTPWDMGYLLTLDEPEQANTASWTDRLHPKKPWLERHKQENAIRGEAADAPSKGPLKIQAFAGGQTKLTGSAYFRFFTWLMLATAVLFVPYALLYRPKTYFQE